MKRIFLLLSVLLLLCGCSRTPDTLTTQSQTTAAAVPSSGWTAENGSKQYIGADGAYHTGWLELDGQRYYFDPNGILQTGWLEVDGQKHYFDANGALKTGWLILGKERYHFDENGNLQTGWLELNGKNYYFNADGTMHTGWLEQDGIRYYLRADGTPAKGSLEIDGQMHHFTSYGEPVLLVNPWNYLPEGYTVDLVYVENGCEVASSCYDALQQMLTDCRAAGFDAQVCSGYRENDFQTELYNDKLNYFLSLGYEPEAAERETGKIVAVPGTSEHQLGLAVDIVDRNRWWLENSTETTELQNWLMEHCWDYGFILRYPNGKSDETGIIFEPWHYRYVGVKLAKELQTSGLCLEEYLDALTQ